MPSETHGRTFLLFSIQRSSFKTFFVKNLKQNLQPILLFIAKQVCSTVRSFNINSTASLFLSRSFA